MSTAHAERPVIVRGRNITKTIHTGAGDLTILKGIDVDLHPGELTLLMGPSGSGKTTLLSILGCILTASGGQLSINGEQAVGLAAEGLADLRRRNIGFVFQGYNLFPTLTAHENVLMALDVRGSLLADPAKSARESLISVGLSHRIDTFPSKLSGGEKQRVAIARSLAGNPAVVLADEPTAALDSENGKAVMELLARVAQDPTRAVLAVTHDHRTLGYADRIIRIEDGLIVADERPNGNAGPRGSSDHAAA